MRPAASCRRVRRAALAALLGALVLVGCSRFPVTPLAPADEARLRTEGPLRIVVEGAAEALVLHTPGVPMATAYQPPAGDALGKHVLYPPGGRPPIVLDDPALDVAAAFTRALRAAWDDVPLQRELRPAAPGTFPTLPAWTGDGRPFLHLRVVRWMLYHGIVPELPPSYRVGFIAQGAVLARNAGRYAALWRGACVLNGAEAQTAFAYPREAQAELTGWLADGGTLLRQQVALAAAACGTRLAGLLVGTPR